MATTQHTFTWAGQGNEVIATGTFDDWKSSLPLTKGEDGKFTATTEVAAGQKISYKYIVDGKWQHNADEPHEADDSGNENNVFTAPAVEPETPATKDESSTKEKVVAAAAAVGGVGALGGVAAVASGAVNGAPKDVAAAVVAAEPAHTTPGVSYAAAAAASHAPEQSSTLASATSATPIPNEAPLPTALPTPATIPVVEAPAFAPKYAAVAAVATPESAFEASTREALDKVQAPSAAVATPEAPLAPVVLNEPEANTVAEVAPVEEETAAPAPAQKAPETPAKDAQESAPAATQESEKTPVAVEGERKPSFFKRLFGCF